MISVVHAGASTSVRDLGRVRAAHRGVSIGGAADRVAHVLANRAVGNADDACALELTLLGPTLRFDVDATIAIVGAPFDGAGARDMRAGEILKLGSCARGLRAALAIRGGVRAPAVDAALRAGDVISIGDAAGPSSAIARYVIDDAPLRITLGPHPFPDDVVARFVAHAWSVAPDSSRRGIRLRGDPVSGAASTVITEGHVAGAIQLLPSGQPIILFVDQATTGGYPKIAHVISADLHRVAQLRPGARVRFLPVTFAEARTAWLDQLRSI